MCLVRGVERSVANGLVWCSIQGIWYIFRWANCAACENSVRWASRATFLPFPGFYSEFSIAISFHKVASCICISSSPVSSMHSHSIFSKASRPHPQDQASNSTLQHDPHSAFPRQVELSKFLLSLQQIASLGRFKRHLEIESKTPSRHSHIAGCTFPSLPLFLSSNP